MAVPLDRSARIIGTAACDLSLPLLLPLAKVVASPGSPALPRLHRSKELSVCLSYRLFARRSCLSQSPFPKVGSLGSPFLCPSAFILD